ncbi:MAG: hypothetical protein M1829_005048 [Trizodia sp. TS-e1964]|nr:MAG: hypothetical protein M1829_005048 [Trizodia sp. TS-e1964]
MSLSTAGHLIVPASDLQSFSAHLKSSNRILALLGAGLSASSGLPTFRGAGGLWRNHDAMTLATPEAFNANPGLVWQFYSYRRHMALRASPNKAHFALVELARRKPGFLTLSQNVDGLSPRAGHPDAQLHLLHGSLFDVKCTSFYCQYMQKDNFEDPIVPALAIPNGSIQPEPAVSDKTGRAASESIYQAMRHTASNGAAPDISDAAVQLSSVNPKDLPHCPKCKEGLLRPGVVWFGEGLPEKVIDSVEDWISESKQIDLILVIGTSARVYPAAGYIDKAREKGARVAIINTDRADGADKLADGDWFFEGDAGVVVPQILREVIGNI